MLIRETSQYSQALQALQSLKKQLGASADIKAIATLLLYAAQCEALERPFVWVGMPGDTRDEAIVNAYESAYQRMLRGEDDEDDEYN